MITDVAKVTGSQDVTPVTTALQIGGMQSCQMAKKSVDSKYPAAALNVGASR